MNYEFVGSWYIMDYLELEIMEFIFHLLFKSLKNLVCCMEVNSSV